MATGVTIANRATPSRLIALLAALSVSGCAGQGAYPSLGQRPAERAYGSAPVAGPANAAPAPMPAPDAPPPARIDAAREAARAGQARFSRALTGAERLVSAASGDAPGGDRWNQAQAALADLIAARSQTATALVDLDALLLSTAQAGGPLETVQTAQAEANGIVGAQDAAIARLAGRLRQ